MILKKLILSIFLLFFVQITVAQQRDWLNSLQIAKNYAQSENKMILMVWNEATQYPFAGVVKNNEGRNIYLKNIFASEAILNLFWEHFIPVVVNEEVYEALFVDIKGKRKQSYIDVFNDDSLKVMDSNGNILGTSGAYTEVLSISNFIIKYSLDSSYLKQELLNYSKEKNFYSTYYLASKYIDYSILVNKKVRSEILALSNIYFKEAEMFLQKDKEIENKANFLQRIQLTVLKQDLVKGKANRVLKNLKKIEKNPIADTNQSQLKFLKYTAYRLKNDTEKFAKLEKEISLLNKKQTQLIVDINR